MPSQAPRPAAPGVAEGRATPRPLNRLVHWAGPDPNTRGIVLGLLTIGALLAAEGTRNDTYIETTVAVSILLVMYWLGHGYATALGQRIEEGEPWELSSTLSALRREVTILVGGIVPLGTLLVCWSAGFSLNTGVLAAIIASAVAIVALEVVAGMRASRRPTEILADATFGATLGVGLLVVKIILH
jgi:hypothetical protein